MVDKVVADMFSTAEHNEFLEVTYANGEKETFYFKDFASGALIEGVVSRAKKTAIKRAIATKEKGLKSDIWRTLLTQYLYFDFA